MPANPLPAQTAAAWRFTLERFLTHPEWIAAANEDVEAFFASQGIARDPHAERFIASLAIDRAISSNQSEQPKQNQAA